MRTSSGYYASTQTKRLGQIQTKCIGAHCKRINKINNKVKNRNNKENINYVNGF